MDCRFYLAVDVFSGMCKKNKSKINPDIPFCPDGEPAPKCKFCEKYTSEREYLGKCMGDKLAYPDMNAVKCVGFRWINLN